MTDKQELATSSHIRLSEATEQEMRINAPTMDSLPRILQDDKIPWIDKRRVTKEFLRKEMILLKDRMDRAVKVERSRLELATEAELARLNTIFAFEALRTQATIQRLFQTLGMEVMENLETFMIDYAKQTTRHKREIKKSKEIEPALKERLITRTDKSFNHLLGTIENLVDTLFSKIELEQTRAKLLP